MDGRHVTGQASEPPLHHLRLLARFAPAAAVLFGLVTIGLLVGLMDNVVEAFTTAAIDSRTAFRLALSIAVNLALAAAAGVTCYRLGVHVPRTLSGWRHALRERRQVRQPH